MPCEDVYFEPYSCRRACVIIPQKKVGSKFVQADRCTEGRLTVPLT